MTLTGVNFGSAGIVTLSPGATPDTVAVATVVTYTDRTVTIVLPAEQGPKNVTITVANQTSNAIAFRYDGPTIQWSTNVTIPTDGARSVTLTGANLGTRGATATVSYPAMNVTLVPNRDSAASADDATANAAVTYTRGIDDADCVVRAQTHDRIVVDVPAGMGVGVVLTVRVTTALTATGDVDVVTTNSVAFDYSPPEITDVVPNVLNARGSANVQLFGNNFGFLGNGRLSAGGVVPPPVVHFNGRPCLNASLVPSVGACDVTPGLRCSAWCVFGGICVHGCV